MSVRIKLEPKLRTKIRQDWLKIFPSFGKKTNVSITRIVGPLQITIGFNYPTFIHEYKVSTFVTPLCKEGEISYAFLSIMADNLRLRSASWREHETGKYLKLAEAIREAAIIPIEGAVSLNTIMEGYKKFVSRPHWMYIEEELSDPVLIAGWAGRPDIAIEYLNWVKPYYEKQTKSIEEDLVESIEQKNKDRIIYLQELLAKKNVAQWYDDLYKRAHDQETLRKITEEQTIALKLSKLPYEDLAPD